jgi:hypothetical protein
LRLREIIVTLANLEQHIALLDIAILMRNAADGSINAKPFSTNQQILRGKIPGHLAAFSHAASLPGDEWVLQQTWTLLISA